MSRNAFVHADPDAERDILGSIFLEGIPILDEVAAIVRAEDFYDPRNRAIFAAVQALAARGERPDLVNLRAQLLATKSLTAAGGDEYVLARTEHVPISAHVEDYAKRVRELAAVRRMIDAAGHVYAHRGEPIEDAEAFLDEAEATIAAAALERAEESSAAGAGQLAEELYQDTRRREETPDSLPGIGWGFAALNEAAGHMEGGHLVILGGRPGMGKSALAHEVALAVARGTHAVTEHKANPREGESVLVFSLEMARIEWARRMAASMSKVPLSDVQRGRMSREDSARFYTALGELSKLPIWIDETPAISLPSLRSKARRHKAKHGLGLVILDYLQLMRSGETYGNREQEVAAISRGLKALAKELEVPILALCQLNRAGDGKMPTIADLRESGQIEQDADTILFVFRPEVAEQQQDSPRRGQEPAVKGQAQIGIAKARHGSPDLRFLRYRGFCTRFEDWKGENTYPASYGGEPRAAFTTPAEAAEFQDDFRPDPQRFDPPRTDWQ